MLVWLTRGQAGDATPKNLAGYNFIIKGKVRRGRRISLSFLSVCVLSRFSHVQLYATLWTAARQTPLFMRFSRQEYWSGLLCPRPGDLSDPGSEPTSRMSPALAGRFLTTSPTWEATFLSKHHVCIILSSSRLVRRVFLSLHGQGSSKIYCF